MKLGMKWVYVCALLLSFAAPAFGQGGATSSITGVVVDTSGGAIPGVTVTAKNDGTAESAVVITSSNGSFTIPSLQPGKYTVTVTMQGFKTVVLKDVTANAGIPANVKPVLEIGGLSETVVVESATKIVQTQSSAASTTVDTNQILNLPVGSRSGLDFVQFLPGVNTAGSVRDSSVAGLPQSAINITLDGVSIQDNYLKTTDGFFARVSPRLDAIEEVTLTMAGQGADATGQGSVQIKFTTRSGTNQYNSSLYHYYQSDSLNTNTYSNKVRGLPKGPLRLNQPGGRIGGPVVIPGLYDGHGKAFFFVNYEMSYSPSTITTNSNVPNASVLNGDFFYNGGPAGGVNLFALAAANGVTATPDPIVLKLLQDIRASTANQGVFTAISGNPNTQTYSFQQSVTSKTPYPTVKVDYNLSSRHRISYATNFTLLKSDPDTTNSRQATFPGFPGHGAQISNRYQFTGSLRSTLSNNLVNEVRYGGSGGATQFSPGINPGMYNGPLANQGGFRLGIGGGIGLTAADPSASTSAREPTTRLFEDTLTWLKGSHSLGMGFSYTRLGIWVKTQNAVNTIGFDVLNGDPALGMFNSTNFPGSSSGDRNNARTLYALLTGDVSNINSTARLDGTTGKYVYNGQSYEQGRLQQADSYIQDNWRLRPNLSLNLGLRYALQLPFEALNGSYSTTTLDSLWGVSGYKPGCNLSAATSANCNLFHPGNATFPKPSFINFGKGVSAYNTDWNNLAPTVGFNWQPNYKSKILQKIFGDENSERSISAGYARAYERHGMSDFTDVFQGNPGININANRNTGNGNIFINSAGAAVSPPVLFRSGYLGQAPFCSQSAVTGCLIDAPTYPLTNNTATGSLGMFDPNLQVPYSDNYTAGIARSLTKKMAIEVRYVGTRSHDLWTTYNYNEANIIENGFLDEFKKAQANLQANLQATGTASFAYTGVAGTSPLPIYLAFFSGTPASGAGNTAAYTSTNFTNSNFVNSLGMYNANPFTPAGTNANTGLAGDPTRQQNSINAGLPANFFRANPDMLGGANAVGQGGFTKYDSIQLVFRRRLSDGLQLDANYNYGREYDSSRYSFRVPRITTRRTGSDGNVDHAFKMTWVYDLPYGRGKRFGTNVNPWIDYTLGGWVWSGTTRVQSGRLIDLGNVRVVGMTEKEAVQAFHLRKIDPAPGANSNLTLIAYSWPQDIIDNTIKAFSTSATSLTGYGSLGPPSGRYFAPANGPDCIETISNAYGDCGVRSLVVTGPNQVFMDMSLRKNINFARRAQFQVSVEIFNVLNRVQWQGVFTTSTTLANWQSGLPGSSRTMQIGTRFTW